VSHEDMENIQSRMKKYGYKPSATMTLGGLHMFLNRKQTNKTMKKTTILKSM
jgi:hypothetical protein